MKIFSHNRRTDKINIGDFTECLVRMKEYHHQEAYLATSQTIASSNIAADAYA